jgi:O-antigen ligase
MMRHRPSVSSIDAATTFGSGAPCSESRKGLATPLIVVTHVIFVVFLCAGHFKGNPGLNWIPFDLTVAAACLVIALAVPSFFAIGGRIRLEVLWLLSFFAMMAIAASWTEWTPYGFEKATRFFSLTLLAAMLPAFIVTDVKAVKRLVWLIIVLGTILAAGVPIQIMNGGFTGGIAERTAGFATVTTALGWDAGLALVALYAYSLRGGKWAWLALPCLPLFVAIVASGARGPLFVALGVVAFFAVRFIQANGRSAGITFVLVAIAAFAISDYSSLLPQGSVKRITTLLQGQYEQGAYERVLCDQAAVDAIAKHPLGMGFGGFAHFYNFGSRTDRIYPHNLLLDIAVDNGLGPAVLFLVIIVAAVLRGYRAAVAAPDLRPFFSMLLFVLGNSLVSGELNADRTLFTLLGIALQLPALVSNSELCRAPANFTFQTEAAGS